MNLSPRTRSIAVAFAIVAAVTTALAIGHLRPGTRDDAAAVSASAPPGNHAAVPVRPEPEP